MMAVTQYKRKPTPTKQWLLREEEAIYAARSAGETAGQATRFRLIDVFAGAGGMTLGFSSHFSHAFDSVWANDFDKASVDTYNANFGSHCTLGNILDVIADKATNVPEADVVIGGPPCQGFSLLNEDPTGG